MRKWLHGDSRGLVRVLKFTWEPFVVKYLTLYCLQNKIYVSAAVWSSTQPSPGWGMGSWTGGQPEGVSAVHAWGVCCCHSPTTFRLSSSAPATPEKRQETAHCKLNNLFGEACLGDLDFSLFKRRHSSVHNHSTVNMMKRSKPITKFLLKKSAAVQKRLVSFARRKAVSQRRTSPERESSDHRTTAVPPRTKSKEWPVNSSKAIKENGGNQGSTRPVWFVSLQRELGEVAIATQNKNS